MFHFNKKSSSGSDRDNSFYLSQRFLSSVKISLSDESFVKYTHAQFMKIINLLQTLIISIRCKNIHINQAKYPLNFINGKSTTALFCPIVAVESKSLYS